MKEGLKKFESFLDDALKPSPENLYSIANYVLGEGKKFAAEVAIGIEALEIISSLVNQALQKGDDSSGTTIECPIDDSDTTGFHSDHKDRIGPVEEE